jgi:hypothetical protein
MPVVTPPGGHAAVSKSDLHQTVEYVARKEQRAHAAERAHARAERDPSCAPEVLAERKGALRFAEGELARARYELECVLREARLGGTAA